MSSIVKNYNVTWSVIRHLRTKRNLKDARFIFSKTGKWTPRLADVRSEIEEYWIPKIQKRNRERHKDNRQSSNDKYYVLSMFPYPSGSLHMGHVRVYSISDVIARFHRLSGKEVIHPMGWDAFGLPAENAAIDHGELPEAWTRKNIASMKKQLDDMCFSFDWDTEYATCDPVHYKWTQFIFLKMFEAGLTQYKEGMVNWDPVDNTVLADEQIDEKGCSWRSGAKVEKRFLKQWYIKTTAYAKSLLDGLSDVDENLWKDVIKLQKRWIGSCDGTRIDFKLTRNGEEWEEPMSVFTTMPECIYGVSHIALPTKHRLNIGDYHSRNQTQNEDILLSVQAIHPFTGELLPLIVTKEIPNDPFHPNNEKLGIPCVSQNDKDLAEKMRLQYVNVIRQEGDQENIENSHQLSGLKRNEAFDAVIKLAKERNIGGHMIGYQSKDWLISRQRYWGTPIPIIHCVKCKAVPVPYEDLPVKLPSVSEFTGKSSPLKEKIEWISVKCPKCGGPAQRETDTMDTFVDSSWYFLRYLDVSNIEKPFSAEKANKYMPVDVYIGGKEHAILHLYFARFFNHFLCDQNYLKHREPFVNLLTQGMVLGQSYSLKNGKYLRKEEVDFSGNKPVEKSSGEPVKVQWEKMSKSKFNGANPQEYISRHGVDLTRLAILASVPPKTDRQWSDEAYVNVQRWQSKVWNLITQYIEKAEDSNSPAIDPESLQNINNMLFEERNYVINEVTITLETLFNTSIVMSKLFEFVNKLIKDVPVEARFSSKEYEKCLADLIIMVAPFAPCFSEELWAGLSSVAKYEGYLWGKSVFDQTWPKIDNNMTISVGVTFNKRYRLRKVKMKLKEFGVLSEEEVIKLCEEDESFRKYIKPKYVNFQFLRNKYLQPSIDFTVPKIKFRLEKREKDYSGREYPVFEEDQGI